jgi:hypothetical protein
MKNGGMFGMGQVIIGLSTRLYIVKMGLWKVI